MFLRSGFLLSCIAIALQIAVFLQPLLPKQYQIAPVCETIALVLVQEKIASMMQHHRAADDQTHSHVNNMSLSSDDTPSVSQHLMTHQHDASGHDHQDPNHQCQYCKVFAQQVLPTEFDLTVVIDRIQVKLLAFKQSTLHIYFVLQRLFLTPQGRAPPVLA